MRRVPTLALGLGVVLSIPLAFQMVGATVPLAAIPIRHPNIVLVTIDALRADHLSSYGYTRLTSPGIDAFARGAVRFENAIAQAPYTKASIASLMTGLYPSSHKTISASVPFSDAMSGHPVTPPITTDVLPSSATTLAKALHDAGYQTLGFTTNPFLIEAFGYARGFDRFRFYPGADFRGADQVVADALDTVRAAGRRRPLFLWVHLIEPHSPYTPPAWTAGTFHVRGTPEPIAANVPIPEWLLPGMRPGDRRFYVAAYDNEIAAADVAVDTLIRELHDLLAWRDTVYVVTADHGEEFLDHGGWEHNSTLYDELIRVPLAISAPGMAPANVTSQVQLIDLFPTLLGFAGADIPPNAGRSLLPMLQGHRESRPAMAELVGTAYALREDNWKLIASDDGEEQLFDLARDPHEDSNLASVQQRRVAAMHKALDALLADAIQRGRELRGQTVPVDPVVADRLRALGYVQR